MRHEKRAMRPSPFPIDANRQNRFLRMIVLLCIDQPWIAALWLGGSAGRGEADQWSSVDLYLLIGDPPGLSQAQPQIRTMLDNLLPDGWSMLGLQNLEHTAVLEGISHAKLPTGVNQGGVRFRIAWTTPTMLARYRSWFGPAHLLWSRDDLADEITDVLAALLAAPVPRLNKGEPAAVQLGLTEFWRWLAGLPAVINRGEHLAAAALLHQARESLTDLVVALNGATRPLSLARVNPYLGPAQREAFEKTLPISAVDSESWIGQAVALIVLYRWYAPQLVDMYSVLYPAALETTVLALLSAEVAGWPARITTG